MAHPERDNRGSTRGSAAKLAERILALPARQAVLEAILEHSFKWARDEILADQDLVDAESNYQGRLSLVVLALGLSTDGKTNGRAVAKK
jgi:hypothetical protein